MPAPAAASAALKAAGKVLGRAAASRALRRRQGGGGGLGSGLMVVVLLVVAAPVGLVIGLVLMVGTVAGGQQQACAPAGGGGPLPANFSGPGSLGEVGGTGIERSLVERVRSTSPFAGKKITPGAYGTTAYGPPWGGIQGAGDATSGGLPIRGKSPRIYMVAVDTDLIGHGTFIYIWPNPFEWKGAFLAADTGGAIKGKRIDFYDWRGRKTQRGWGLQKARVSSKPIAGDGGGQPSSETEAPAATGLDAGACDEAPSSLATPGENGKVVVHPGADRPGVKTRKPVIDFLERTAGVYGERIVLTTGTAHSQRSSSGSVSDHWVGLGADMGSVINKFQDGGKKGTRMAAAALRAAGVPERLAQRTARRGGGHNVCYRGWRVQVIWRTGGHLDHVHIGLKRGCNHEGIQTFQIGGG
jgi:3D (Asp-Asp-Asp) domain-containing protein